MVSVIVYNKIVTSFKATIILKISQLKVKSSIIVTSTVHYFRPKETVCIHGNYEEFLLLEFK